MSETIATTGPNKWSSARTGGDIHIRAVARNASGGERRDIPAATQLILALPGRNNTTAAKLVALSDSSA